MHRAASCNPGPSQLLFALLKPSKRAPTTERPAPASKRSGNSEPERSAKPQSRALPPASAGVPAGRITGRDWIAWLLPVAAVLIAFWPALSGGFIWDDDAHVIANPCIVGPQGLWDIWTTSAARICPLVLSTFWLEYKLWGMNPLPYHLVNILVHAASGLVLWRVLRALGVRGAWLGALLWAVHPVQTESVAWITELKNTQSGLFYLLSVLFYVRMLRAQQQPGVAQICNLHLPPGKGTLEGSAAAGSHGGRDYAWALVFGALGMASKTSVVVLPVVLALCGWWVEGRWRWSRLKWLAPLVLMALGAAVLALWTQHLEGANHEAWARSVPERIVAAGCVVWFYLGKLAVAAPADLHLSALGDRCGKPAVVGAGAEPGAGLRAAVEGARAGLGAGAALRAGLLCGGAGAGAGAGRPLFFEVFVRGRSLSVSGEHGTAGAGGCGAGGRAGGAAGGHEGAGTGVGWEPPCAARCCWPSGA